MEVLRHGKKYKEIECPECNALLAYNIKDIEVRCTMDVNWNDDWRNSITCPECGEIIYL